jgi:hypothetical protein
MAKTAEFRRFFELARILLRWKQARRRASETQGSGNEIMTYEAANVRNAFVAVTIAFLASAVLMAGAVGPAIA